MPILAGRRFLLVQNRDSPSEKAGTTSGVRGVAGPRGSGEAEQQKEWQINEGSARTRESVCDRMKNNKQQRERDEKRDVKRGGIMAGGRALT